jgi:hypothetical protein
MERTLNPTESIEMFVGPLGLGHPPLTSGGNKVTDLMRLVSPSLTILLRAVAGSRRHNLRLLLVKVCNSFKSSRQDGKFVSGEGT